MSGLDSIKSKLKRLGDESQVKPEYVSVVRYKIGHKKDLVFPENCNPGGVLLVPEKMTAEEWVNTDFSIDE
jgi:hypothetical protein